MFCLLSVRFASSAARMEVNNLVKRLQAFAPPKLAESWDNTGLLIEPSGVLYVTTMLLTNDLTENVVDEAVKIKANMILSYHPTIFKPLKRLVQRSWKERIVVKCIENRIAVFSPHTTYDTLDGGVNDWLISPFGGKVSPLSVWTSSSTSTHGDRSVTITVPSTVESQLQKQLDQLVDVTVIGTLKLADSCNVQLKLNCTEQSLTELTKSLQPLDGVLSKMEIVNLSKPPMPNYGQGRCAVLDHPITIQQSVDLVKAHLKLPHVRLALAVGRDEGSDVKSVAVCAGSGSSVLAGVRADLYVTGEMSHHEVLDATHNGASVLLCEHSNTERGFLTVLQQKLSVLLDNLVDIRVSERDKDPLEIV